MKEKEETKSLKTFRFLIGHGEWASLMATFIGVTMYWSHRIDHIESRLDANLLAMNKRIDQVNVRCDELHREFCELLKEMRKQN